MTLTLAQLPQLPATGALKGPGLIPGTLAACPCYCRRPRDQATFQAASDAALGEQVREFDAADLANLAPGVEIWMDDAFWPLKDVTAHTTDPQRVLVLLGAGCCGIKWDLRCDAPVYVKIDLPLPMSMY